MAKQKPQGPVEGQASLTEVGPWMDAPPLYYRIPLSLGKHFKPQWASFLISRSLPFITVSQKPKVTQPFLRGIVFKVMQVKLSVAPSGRQLHPIRM